MNIHITQVCVGFDHAGEDLSHAIIEHVNVKGYSVSCPQQKKKFHGASIPYPSVVPWVVGTVLSQNTWGLLVCGSGIGMSIAANRYIGIRAALCRNESDAMLARQHNNANVLVLGGRTGTLEEALLCLWKFLTTPFSQGRHEERVCMLDRMPGGGIAYGLSA
ncbi:RpiB/LacA/LacB family sugar-phosphate isomerase [Holospora curviuscula]|uniref:Ribose-5-phosphate isomerase B n=1 Tax=Holospora curviuscula TaxID=1082868 RepID=A0A2S5RI75_9PROT|nr:RpiB/LacA/LacB family sugar-phosphate isomerase [Holospora curviuscula]PPE06865.1 Ribose-5-phosphate isomerase B [Holospora curviuscula]